MTILILDNDKYLPESADKPVPGKHYNLEDAVEGTQAQNKLFHALVTEYWKSGLHPKYGGDDYDSFRDQIKRTIGAGFDRYVYSLLEDDRLKIKVVKHETDIPEFIRNNPHGKDAMYGILKSWSAYTKKERQHTIDNLLDDMTAVGVQSKKFDEIREGLDA